MNGDLKYRHHFGESLAFELSHALTVLFFSIRIREKLVSQIPQYTNIEKFFHYFKKHNTQAIICFFFLFLVPNEITNLHERKYAKYIHNFT